MKNNPLVTLYITNWNYAGYIQESIESALKQTFNDFELIIIDDGSTDLSREIILTYEEVDRVRIIFQENKGLNATNNVAIHAARGKYIMRLDADDYLDENALLVMVNTIDSNPDLAMVFPDYYYVDKKGEITAQERRHNFKDEVTLLDQPAHGACSLVRKDVLVEVGAYSSKFSCQDGYDLWLKIIENYSVRNINLPLFYYRQHGKNLTTNNERILKTRAEIYEIHAERSNKEELHVVAVLPVRGEKIDPLCLSMMPLHSKPLINWTIDAALESKKIDELIVSSPDEKLLSFLKQKYGESVKYCSRSREISRENVSYLPAVKEALKHEALDRKPDAVFGLTIDAPFRSSMYIDKAVNTMRIFEVDCLIGVVPENDQFFRHNGAGLKSVGFNEENSNLRLERDYLYRQTGGFFLAKYDQLLSKQKLFDTPVGHIVLSQKAGLKILTKMDCRLAERYLEIEKH
jgi:CMP-N-acetylneuraminic acid synthetase